MLGEPGFLEELSSCELCEHRCRVDRLAGEEGVCRVTMPAVASRALHPAPPQSYTIFMAGCNLKCLNCQNWNISQYPDSGQEVEGYVEPEALARQAVGMLESPGGKLMGADRLFFSGGEPTLHLPYIERVVSESRRISPGCMVNFDTNGFMTEGSLERILGFADSITFDLKAYDDDTHLALTGAPAALVLRNAETAARKAPEKIWEFRITVIPGINEEDVGHLCRFLAGISRDLPVCFLAFRPNFVLGGHPGAPGPLMDRCVRDARLASLTRVSRAGFTDIPGSPDPILPWAREGYRKAGAVQAASSAGKAGCVTLPRACRACPSMSRCSLKRYVPERSC